MNSTPSKRGRKARDHKCSWDGSTINGLYRKPSGVWRVRATGQEFTEPDERLAVARFHEIMARRNPPSNLGKPKVHADFNAALGDVLQRARANGGSIIADISSPMVSHGMHVVTDDTLTPRQWTWLREKFLTEPKWVAQKIGIEQLGWLPDLKKPTRSPTLKELGDVYVAKPGLSINEVSRSKLFWREFSKAVGVDTVGDLTHEHVGRYEAVVQGAKYAPKSILHRYRKVRTILAYAIKRGRGIEDCRRALDVTAMLEVKEHTPLDPKPISVADFGTMYAAATKAGDKTFAAMLLVSMNAAMYAGEASALKWEEVDLTTGEIVTRRPKTGVSRVAVLAERTVEALKELPRVGDHVFNTRVRSYTVFSALASWRKYREAADLPEDLVFGQIRDAAFTVACRVSLDQARVLAGHRLPGASDHYIRRSPQFVGDACRAIETIYFAGLPAAE
jgi:integrase